MKTKQQQDELELRDRLASSRAVWLVLAGLHAREAAELGGLDGEEVRIRHRQTLAAVTAAREQYRRDLGRFSDLVLRGD